MAELKRWSGNDTTDISLRDNEFQDIIFFARKFSKVYLFGNGHIGKAMEKYLQDSGIMIRDILTSDNIGKVSEEEAEKYGVIIGVGDIVLSEILSVVKKYFRNEKIYIPKLEVRENIGNILGEETWKEQFWLNIYVTNKCNLGCKSCSAFAPICKPDFYEIELFRKDIDRVAKIGLNVIHELKFTGAEAMLHPDILEMLSYTRNMFPNIKIQVYTNGLFIRNYEDEKLKKLSELNIILVITEYPLPNLCLKYSYDRLNKFGISYFVIYAEEQKYFSKRPLRFEKDVSLERYIECPRYKMCKSLFLFRGRLYKCIYAISAPYVNDAFGKNLEVKKADYVDIYNTDANEIYRYATRRIPFCSYCSPIEERVPWGLSERKIEEWA